MIKIKYGKDINVLIQSIKDYAKVAAICNSMDIKWLSGHDPTEYIASGLIVSFENKIPCWVHIDSCLTWSSTKYGQCGKTYTPQYFEKMILHVASKSSNYASIKSHIETTKNKLFKKDKIENWKFC